jgi:hypothetical protein
MRMPRYRIKTLMLGVLILAIVLGVDAQFRRLCDEPPLSIRMFVLEGILVVISLPFTAPLAWMLYLNWTENAYLRRLQRDDTPAVFPRTIADSDWPSPD